MKKNICGIRLVLHICICYPFYNDSMHVYRVCKISVALFFYCTLSYLNVGQVLLTANDNLIKMVFSW